MTDYEESLHSAANNAGAYSSVCIELEIESLAVNTLLQHHHIHDIDGTSNFVAFHTQQQTSVQVCNLEKERVRKRIRIYLYVTQIFP